MTNEMFDRIAEAARAQDGPRALELLAEHCRAGKNYPLLFETMLMSKRLQLGLPLIQTGPLGDLAEPVRRAYEDAYIEAARVVGGLFLADGDIARAWPYFRAIGEPAAVAEAIERIQPADGIDAIIEIAFHERANPRKGFELILAQYGTCSAITTFEQYPAREGRQECAGMLVRKVHMDLMENLRGAIAQQEGQPPEEGSIQELLRGRDWLFADNNYHIDTSHLASVIRFSLELEDQQLLAMALDLAEYGRRLAPMFHFRGSPPFDQVYEDHAMYLRALLGDQVDSAIAHFRAKLAASDPAETGSAPAQVLVMLLARLERYTDALELSAQHLLGVESGQLVCPSIPQLCQMAGEPGRLMELSRAQGDLLSFTAAALEAAPAPR